MTYNYLRKVPYSLNILDIFLKFVKFHITTLEVKLLPLPTKYY